MRRPPPISTRPVTLFPYTTRFRALGAERFGQFGFQRGDVGLLPCLAGAGLLRRRRQLAGGELLRAVLDLAHRPAVLGRVRGQLAGQLRRQREQRTRVAHLQPPPLEQRTDRSEEHTSELQSLMRISYAVFCLKKKKK